MSSFVFMKVLESAPRRYDRGMNLLFLGRMEQLHEAIAAEVAAPGRRILDLGCGTGGVALASARRGATVTGIDTNPQMLEIARAKPLPPGAPPVEWLELGATEIEDAFPPESFHAVTASLVLSELGPLEQAYALRTARSRLRPGGVLVIADEIVPAASLRRLAWWAGRLPLVCLTYLLTQTTTRALEDPGGLVRAAGFAEIHERRFGRGTVVLLTARRGEAGP
ncbi:MAG: methyltransferase domain-containing protein [Acidobacteria bacterium]|nr:methyltransferase domain-containing protein [Acidobacteriota bacterium]